MGSTAHNPVQRRPPSGEHACGPDCPQESRLQALEARQDDHSDRINAAHLQLGEGSKQFIRLEMGLASVAEKVGELIAVLKWAAFGLASFVFLLGGGTIVWAIAHSGGKVAGAP